MIAGILWNCSVLGWNDFFNLYYWRSWYHPGTHISSFESCSNCSSLLALALFPPLRYDKFGFWLKLNFDYLYTWSSLSVGKKNFPSHTGKENGCLHSGVYLFIKRNVNKYIEMTTWIGVYYIGRGISDFDNVSFKCSPRSLRFFLSFLCSTRFF